MTLAAGTRLGPYEVLGPIGAGGMGEVYRARDARLGRDVAVKVLPADLSRDAERLARFEREARSASQISDPHVISVFDVGREGEVVFLVTELVSGSDLRALLEGERLPVARAVEIGAQIAEGLAAAHENGIVHRDLKPENVLLTPAGLAKIADFGLAKPATARFGSAEADALTRSSYTEPGVLMGTVGYMSPEQVRGQEVDGRTDIFSLGCVLVEMLTGQRPFRRETAAETIAAILGADALDASGRHESIPPALDRILRRCLEKRAGQRFQSARDLAFALRVLVSAAEVASAPPSRTAVPTTHSTLPLPDGARLAGNAPPVLAISRDGSKVAYVAIGDDGPPRLYVCHLDRGETQRVPESEFALGPFFSADGAWLAFAADVSEASPRRGELRMFSFASGMTQAICPLTEYAGGCWADDGSIYYVGAVAEGLFRVPAGAVGADVLFRHFRVGGTTSARCVGYPRLVPGDRAVLVLDWDASFLGDLGRIDLGSGELSSIAHSGSTGVALRTGHLLHSRTDGTVLAVPVDPAGRACGPAVAVLKDVALDEAGGVFAVSENGTLVFARGQLRGSVFETKRLLRIRRGGEIEPLPFPPEDLRGRPSLSPDGRRLAVASRSSGIWIHDLVRGTRLRLPRGSTRIVHFPIWSADGRQVFYRAARVGVMGWNLVRQGADGGSEPVELMPPDGTEKRPRAVTPDGRTLVFEALAGAESGLFGLALDEPATARRLVRGVFTNAQLSPDGRFVAYESGEFGSVEVFVQRLTEHAHREQVSVGGGRGPLWSRDGRRLFYRNGDDFFAVPFDGRGDEPALEAAQRLFRSAAIEEYEAAPDGDGFLALAPMADSGIVRRIELVTGWFSELERLVPVRGR